MAENSDQFVSYRFTARSLCDGQVHLVNAPLDAVVYPSAYTTRCGQPAAGICRDGPPASCTGAGAPPEAHQRHRRPRVPSD